MSKVINGSESMRILYIVKNTMKNEQKLLASLDKALSYFIQSLKNFDERLL